MWSGEPEEEVGVSLSAGLRSPIDCKEDCGHGKKTRSRDVKSPR